jgi:hypothetical protein
VQFPPSPIEVARRGRRVYGLRDRRRQPLWTRAWFWWTGAFSLAIVFWVALGELWLAYAMLWIALWGFRWGFQWLLAIAIAGPAQAIASRREDRLHAQGFYEVGSR